MLKLLGCVLIVAASGGAGFHMARQEREELGQMWQLALALERMQHEIGWNRLRLPELCRFLSGTLTGRVSELFAWVAAQCESDAGKPAAELFSLGFARFHLPEAAGKIYQTMAQTFGRYDPEQQILALQSASDQMRQLCRSRQSEQKSTAKRYRVFGVCIGAAIAIIFF